MNRDKKRNFIAQVKRGKIKKDDFKGIIKYELNQEQRDYILKKLPKPYIDIAYNNPTPSDEKDIGKVEGFLRNKTSLIIELQWYFDVLKKYNQSINDYILIKDDIEIAIMNNNFDESYYLLDELDEKVCCSLFALQTELYLNEINNDSNANKELIKDFPIEATSLKLIILLEFSRLRVDKTISSWQYDSTLEQHKKQYPSDSANLVEYVDYKLDPVRYENKLTYLPFLSFYDSDLSIIDRYNSLKNILSIILFENNIENEEKEIIIEKIKEFPLIFKDSYWEKLLLLIDNNYKKLSSTKDTNNYYKIQDHFLKGEHTTVIKECNIIFKKQPNFSDLYITYAKSIIFSNQNIKDFLNDKTELYEIIQLVIDILLKNDNYISNRDKLLDKYYLLSHFDFSVSLLVFLYNEFKLTIPIGSKYLSFLKGKTFRYDSYSLFESSDNYNNLTIESNCYKFIRDNLKDSEPKEHKDTIFKFQLKISTLIYQNKLIEAISELEKFNQQFSSLFILYSFIETWYIKTCLHCYFHVNDLKKVSNLIVQVFFKKMVAFDHFFDQKFVAAYNKPQDHKTLEDISVPILFEIYIQPQASIYDRIADFLIHNDFQKPSELFETENKFDKVMFVYFLEKVCTKENLQDSPYLNSIEELEAERIKILNNLKLINKKKVDVYNSEIMSLTKEASLRRGLLQIHESRIYVDTSNIEKHLGIELPEIFDRYLELTDITYSAISSLKLNDKVDKEGIVVTFYLKEPIPENELPMYLTKKDPRLDPNAVTVPVIRFTYFLNIFTIIRQEFIYSEDYGFKSFLSMRIRHGTFSNVLRSVFDKYNLISSKESSSEDYSEIKYWNDNLLIEQDSKSIIQDLLKEFSKNIDFLIDRGLSWISVKNELGEVESGIFDFNFTQDEIYALYHNRMGKIDSYNLFLEETFNVLYERLDKNLKVLRSKISNELSSEFLNKLEDLQSNIQIIAQSNDKTNPIEQSIISCKTDLQLIISQIIKWFNVTKNQYIEEFPIDMIVQNSLDYINSIYTDSIQNASVRTSIKCSSNFKGKYFETFGDMFINIFDNIVSKNKDLGDQLKIDISVVQVKDAIAITIKNNISDSIDKKKLKERIENIIQNVQDYKKEGINSSFEEGSGFLKICKCIAVDLERDNYEVQPRIIKNNFEVNIKFELNKLIV